MTTPYPRDSTAATLAAEKTTRPELDYAGPAPSASAADLAALRARLREVEAVLGLPLRPGQAAPPDLPDLRRRVAALERRAGIVPGLAPLPGCDVDTPPPRATVITSEPAGRRRDWRERVQAALAAAALLAALAWLLHPLPGGPGVARPATAPATAPAAVSAAIAAVPSCAFAEGCAREESAASSAPATDEDTASSPAAFGTGNAGDLANHRSDRPAESAPPAAGPCPGRDLALAGACDPAGGDTPRVPASVPPGIPPRDR
ncbi:MAG TPA: hypothetical protein VFL91_26220 [Thermomicrobiales bacterium]|nr:hypothetical protein [Thermomicrobiales bacterium]